MSNNANLTPLGGAGDSNDPSQQPLGFQARGGRGGRGGTGRGGRGSNRGNTRKQNNTADFAASAHTATESDKLIREQFILGAKPTVILGGSRDERGDKRKYWAGGSPHAKRVQWSNPFAHAGESSYAKLMQKRRWFGVHANPNYKATAAVTAGGTREEVERLVGVLGEEPQAWSC